MQYLIKLTLQNSFHNGNKNNYKCNGGEDPFYDIKKKSAKVKFDQNYVKHV